MPEESKAPEYGWDDDPPLRFMRLRGSYDDVIYWDGKRWWPAEYGPNSSTQTKECWPPWDFGEECIWVEEP